MSRIFRVLYEPSAQEALREAARYIREDSGPGRASEWLRQMLDRVAKLEHLPTSYRIWTDRGGAPVYSKLVSPYRVFFVVYEDSVSVHIIDIVHTSRETRLRRYREP